jgi:drug/metabolite transporter superfamily protein YnfA
VIGSTRMTQSSPTLAGVLGKHSKLRQTNASTSEATQPTRSDHVRSDPILNENSSHFACQEVSKSSCYLPALFPTSNDRGQTAFLLSLFLPLFLLYFFLSFQRASQANWPAAAYVGGFILLAAKWDILAARAKWAKWLGIAAIAIGLIETAALHETIWLNLPPGKDPLDRARGSRDLAAQVSRLEDQTGAKVVIANAYMTASLLAFYLPGQPDTFMPLSSAPYNQLILWPTYREAHPKEDALFVSETNRVPDSLQEDFSNVQPLGVLTTTEDGRTIRRFYAFWCRERPAGSSPSMTNDK